MIALHQFHRDLETVLELGLGSLRGNETLDELYWDSMALVMFIAMADEKYSVVISPSKLAEAKSVADLLALVNQRA
jgi:acyl carrier protein